MRQIKILCDKCRKDITLMVEHHVSVGESYQFDFCEQCYRSLLKHVGDWMKSDIKK